MTEFDRVLVEVVIAAPIDTVWHALRDPETLRRWFGWEYPGLVEEIDFIFQRSIASEADHTLRAPGVPDRYELESTGSGETIVRVIRSAPTTDRSWKGIYDDIFEGWLTFTQQLRFMLERHPGNDRRTIRLSGRARIAGTMLPPEALGLHTIRAVPVGQRYQLATGMGDALAGDVWFRSAYQLGLTVDGYGNGLLIVGARPATEKSPHGGGEIVASTYGMDPAAFAALRDRWVAWWSSQYDTIEAH
jgi:hypothetical protein